MGDRKGPEISLLIQGKRFLRNGPLGSHPHYFCPEVLNAPLPDLVKERVSKRSFPQG